MGIVNTEKLATHISDWIKVYCNNNNTKTVVVPIFTNDPQLTYGALLLITILQKHRTANSPKVISVVEPENKSSYLDQLGVQNEFSRDNAQTIKQKADYAIEVAKNNRGIVIGSLNRTYSRLNRRHGKYDTALADIFPLLDLYYSEVRELFYHYYPEEIITRLDELDFNIERADREEDKSGLITSDVSPTKHKTWFAFTLSQKQAIASLHQREKQTRHKAIIGKPFPVLRNKGLVV